MHEFDTTSFFLILDDKVLDIDMLSMFNKNSWIGNQYGRYIVFKDRSSLIILETKFIQNQL